MDAKDHETLVLACAFFGDCKKHLTFVRTCRILRGTQKQFVTCTHSITFWDTERTM